MSNGGKQRQLRVISVLHSNRWKKLENADLHVVWKNTRLSTLLLKRHQSIESNEPGQPIRNTSTKRTAHNLPWPSQQQKKRRKEKKTKKCLTPTKSQLSILPSALFLSSSLRFVDDYHKHSVPTDLRKARESPRSAQLPPTTRSSSTKRLQAEMYKTSPSHSCLRTFLRKNECRAGRQQKSTQPHAKTADTKTYNSKASLETTKTTTEKKKKKKKKKKKSYKFTILALVFFTILFVDWPAYAHDHRHWSKTRKLWQLTFLRNARSKRAGNPSLHLSAKNAYVSSKQTSTGDVFPRAIDNRPKELVDEKNQVKTPHGTSAQTHLFLVGERREMCRCWAVVLFSCLCVVNLT